MSHLPGLVGTPKTKPLTQVPQRAAAQPLVCSAGDDGTVKIWCFSSEGAGGAARGKELRCLATLATGGASRVVPGPVLGAVSPLRSTFGENCPHFSKFCTKLTLGSGLKGGVGQSRGVFN